MNLLVLEVAFSRSAETLGEEASILTSVVSVEADMVFEVADAVTDDEVTLPRPNEVDAVCRWCCCCWW